MTHRNSRRDCQLRSSRRFLGSAFIAAFVATVLAAQAPPQPQQPIFKTGVNYVRVDAYPTRDGKPVADLTKDDFEIYEDGVLQRLDSFEHVVVRSRAVTEERVEPRNVREANQMAADARNRLFVLFLDTYHVTESSVSHGGPIWAPGSTTTRTPTASNPIGTQPIDRALTNFLNRVVGPTDLFAILTPEMDVDQLSFTRRPENFEALVKSVWGRRFNWDDLDPEENRWGICYDPACEFHCYDGILLDMVRRHREGLALDALHRLVTRLGELREERKAVLLVSEGWIRYRPDQRLARPLAVGCLPLCAADMPKGKGIYIDPNGKLTSGTDPRTFMTVDQQECQSARVRLAQMDNDKKYRDLMDEANRTNTSFYPIDPRGLAVFATPMDYKDLPQTPAAMQTLPPDKALFADAADMRERLETLHSLATATDGSMTETNDLQGQLKKISDDLSDYYLLAYSSTNTKADGKFRKIAVRVKRPGVAVRARRGYLAATEAELAARKAAAAAMDPEIAARNAALASLGTIRADRPVHVAAGVAWRKPADSGATQAAIWVAADLDASAAREPGWGSGAEAAITVMSADGQPVANDRATLSAATRGFLIYMRTPSVAGEYVVRVKCSGKEGAGAETNDQVRVIVPAVTTNTGTTLGEPILFRRGPFTGPAFQPTADLRFRRAERVRVDVPLGTAPGNASVAARVLDRKGQALAVPVPATVREEEGVRFASAEVSLAPLAFGDYLIEVTVRPATTQQKVLTAIRVVQ